MILQQKTNTLMGCQIRQMILAHIQCENFFRKYCEYIFRKSADFWIVYTD